MRPSLLYRTLATSVLSLGLACGALTPLSASAASLAEDLVASAPEGGTVFEKGVTAQLIADPSVAAQFTALLVNASPELRRSLGRAFGAAVVALTPAPATAGADAGGTNGESNATKDPAGAATVSPSPVAADPILTAVAAVTDVEFLGAFSDATGQLATAALGGDGNGRLFGGGTIPTLSPSLPSGSSGPNAAALSGVADPTPNSVEEPTFVGLDASVSPIRPTL